MTVVWWCGGCGAGAWCGGGGGVWRLVYGVWWWWRWCVVVFWRAFDNAGVCSGGVPQCAFLLPQPCCASHVSLLSMTSVFVAMSLSGAAQLVTTTDSAILISPLLPFCSTTEAVDRSRILFPFVYVLFFRTAFCGVPL